MNLLEKTINKYLAYLNSIGIFATKLSAERLYDGTYLNGEPFDYIILKDKAICFDAKESHGEYIQVKEKELKQLKNLLMCESKGHSAFFLCYFYKYKKLCYITASDTQKLLTKKSQIKHTDCVPIVDIQSIM